MRKSIWIVAPLLLSSLLVACSSKQGDMEGSPVVASEDPCMEAAGSITIYSVAAEDTVAEWVQPFEESFGVGVDIYRASDEALAERWKQETRAGQNIADVVIVNDVKTFRSVDEDGWIAEYVPTSDVLYEDDQKHPGKWYSLYETVEVLVWNTNQVSEDEANLLRENGIKALTDSRWDGRVGLVAPSATERVLATYYRWLEDPSIGWKYLEELSNTKPKIYESAIPLSERVVTGEHAVALGVTDSITNRALEQGAPLEYVYENVATSSTFYSAISSYAPNQTAAACFQEWATSDEALSEMVVLSQGLPPRDGVDDKRSVNDEAWYTPPEIQDSEWQDSQEVRDAAADLNDRWDEVFGYGN